MGTIDSIAENMPRSYARLVDLRKKSDLENGESGRGIYWVPSLMYSLLRIGDDSVGLRYLTKVESAPCKDLTQLLADGLPKEFKLPKNIRAPVQYKQPEIGYGSDLSFA